MLACQLEIAGDLALAYERQTPRLTWVRTVDGWERPDSWQLEPIGRRALHPLVVAAGQGLVSLLALVAFAGDEITYFWAPGSGSKRKTAECCRCVW
jgi:hypothetical protein